MSHLVLSERLEEQLPRLIPGILALYKKPAEAYYVSKVSGGGGRERGGPLGPKGPVAYSTCAGREQAPRKVALYPIWGLRLQAAL